MAFLYEIHLILYFLLLPFFHLTHCNDSDADELWQYFQDVIHWVDKLFGRKYKKEMKGVEWGLLYNKHKDTKLTATNCQMLCRECNRRKSSK